MRKKEGIQKQVVTGRHRRFKEATFPRKIWIFAPQLGLKQKQAKLCVTGKPNQPLVLRCFDQ